MHIKIEEFEETHNALEIKAKDHQAANLNAQGERLIHQLGKQLIQELSTMVEEESKVLANVPLDVHRSLDLLYKVLCTKFDPSQVNNDDNTFSSHSSGWDEDHDEEYNTLWPTPLTTPLEEDNMHPPQPQISGPHPGQGWAPNTQGTTHYYQFLIPDPTIR